MTIIHAMTSSWSTAQAIKVAQLLHRSDHLIKLINFNFVPISKSTQNAEESSFDRYL